MESRAFGNTGLKVPPICYGTMRYANKDGMYDEKSKEGARALEAAIERGIDFIHSSYEYKTRWLTSRVLAHHPKRHDLKHIIKVNVPDWGDGVFSQKKFTEQIEQALKELHTERIAIVQHLQRGDFSRDIAYSDEAEPQRVQEADTVFDLLGEVFEKLRQEGKVQHLASFPYTVGYAKRCLQSDLFSGLVAFYNCLETEMSDYFDQMKSQGMAFIGIRALAGGLLTQNRVDRNTLPEGDRFLSPQWDRLYSQLQEFRATLPEEPENWTRFAIRFSISDPFITSTVLSINTIAQLDEVMQAVNEPPVPSEIIEQARLMTARYRMTYGVKGHPSGIPIF